MILDRNDSSGSEVSAEGGTPIHLGRRGYKLRGPITPNDTRNLNHLRRNETNDMPQRSGADGNAKLPRRRMPVTPEDNNKNDSMDEAPKSPERKTRHSRMSRALRTSSGSSDGEPKSPKPKFPANPPRRGYKVDAPIRPNDGRSLAQLRRNETSDMPTRGGRRNPTALSRKAPTR